MTLNKRKEAPLDPFKRAVTLATRSLAADGSVEVVFSTEPPGLVGKTARVPEPSRVPTLDEIAVIRGHADAAALAVACHDEGLHQALAPSGGDARSVFEAIEQARVEAIGAQRMAGVAANLRARVEQRYARKPHHRGDGPHRGAALRCAGPHGARAADGPGPARARPRPCQSLAPVGGGTRQDPARPHA